MTSASTFNELTAQIIALSAQKQCLLEQVSDINAQLNLAQIQVNFLLNQQLPIARLPPELLSEIFHIVQYFFPPSLRHISQVSKQWRCIALGTPTLWRVIDISVPSRYHPSNVHHQPTRETSGTNIAYIRASIERSISKLTNYIQHSSPCPIDIRLNITITHTLERLIEIIKPHSHRWRRLAINVMDAKTRKELRAPLENVYAPLLEHLSLRIGMWQNDYSGIPRLIKLMEESDLRKFGSRARILKGTDESGDDSKRSSVSSADCAEITLIVDGQPENESMAQTEENECLVTRPASSPTPRLNFLRLSGGALSGLQPPMSTITTLHLEGLPCNTDNTEDNPRLMPWVKFRNFFSALPVLTNLSLNQISIAEPISTKHRLDVPSLKALRICGGRTPMRRILPMLKLPNLEDLTLHDVGDFPVSFPHHSSGNNNRLAATINDTSEGSGSDTTITGTGTPRPSTSTSPFPSLRILSLTRCSFSLAELFAVVRVFKDIEVVKIDDCIPDIYRIIGPIMPTTTYNTTTPSSQLSNTTTNGGGNNPINPIPPPNSASPSTVSSSHDGPGWPHLQTMVITSLQPPDVRLFCSMLQNRQDARMQIKRVILWKRTRQVLKQKNKLEYVRAVVEGSRWLEGGMGVKKMTTANGTSALARAVINSNREWDSNSGAWDAADVKGPFEMETGDSIWPNELGYDDLDDTWGDA